MSRPWMPLYIADYRADTAHLSAAEHGAYLQLIMQYWQAGKLPTDDAPLARIACMSLAEWRKAKPTIAAFFGPDWTHKRIDRELAKASDISSKRRASAEQRHGKSNANAEQLDTHARASSPSPSPSPLQKKEDTANAVSSAESPYAFESGCIRLTEKDFRQWEQSFSHLDLRAELLSLTEWASQQPKWFFAVSAALAKRNREAKARAAKAGDAPKFKWNGIEGVV